jgi:hypothetical protein
MSEIGLGTSASHIKNEIKELENQMNIIDGEISDIPELINSANLLRNNESLKKNNEVKSQLIKKYDQYTTTLETLLTTVFEIQNELKDILRDQSELIGQSKDKKHNQKRQTKSTQKKSSKKTKK